jgi:hypothetical protein
MKHADVSSFEKEAYQRNTPTSDSKSLLATLGTDAPLFKKVETLRWRGATPAFAKWADRMKSPRLLERCDRVKLRHAVLRERRATMR